MQKIIEILGYCPKFYLNATWAGKMSDQDEGYYGFETEEEMWRAMLDLTTEACGTSGIMSIIPTGTAIQNARTLAVTDKFNRYTMGGTDLHHLNTAGGFIAACAIYEKIVFPLNGIRCNQSTFRITQPAPMPPSNPVENILVTDSNYLQFCESAVKAIEKPNEVTTIK